MITKSSGDVFADLGFEPEMAQNLKLRSSLMMKLKSLIQEAGWSQTVAAQKLEVTQPRVSDLFRGKIELFTADMLISMLGKLGISAAITLDESKSIVNKPVANAPAHYYLTKHTRSNYGGAVRVQMVSGAILMSGAATVALKTSQAGSFVVDLTPEIEPFDVYEPVHFKTQGTLLEASGKSSDFFIFNCTDAYDALMPAEAQPSDYKFYKNEAKSNAQPYVPPILLCANG